MLQIFTAINREKIPPLCRDDPMPKLLLSLEKHFLTRAFQSHAKFRHLGPEADSQPLYRSDKTEPLSDHHQNFRIVFSGMVTFKNDSLIKPLIFTRIITCSTTVTLHRISIAIIIMHRNIKLNSALPTQPPSMAHIP